MITDETNQIKLPLYDTGNGADLIANDGIYSKYFTQFSSTERYSLSCRVSFLVFSCKCQNSKLMFSTLSW